MNRNINRRITAALLLLFLLFMFSPQSFSQDLSKLTVSVRAVNKPFQAVLDDLTEQCGYYFTFDSRLVDGQKKISLSLKDVTVQKAIDTLFQEPYLEYKIINRNIVIYPVKPQKRDLVKDTLRRVGNRLEVSGMITDLKTGKPLPYATIAVMDSYFGTISNTDGTFLLRIPDTLDQPLLVTSYIGYKNQYTPVSFNNREAVKISMNKSLISLQEVIIRYQDPASLLSESIKRINKNYMNEAAGMQAYYREKVKKDDKCMLFSEAVVEIAKAPYSSSLAIERTRLLKGRKITNIDFQDTVILKIQSGLNSMLQLDIVKNPPLFLSEDFSSLYNLRFSDVVSFKDRLVYVISFEQKENVVETLFRGDIYIDRESLAIIAADFNYDPLRLAKEENMFVAKKSRNLKIRPLSAQYHVEYSQTGDNYHFSQAQGEVRFKLRKRREWISSKYQINLEIAVTNIEPGNPPRIRSGEQLKPSTIMSDQVFDYDPDFWGDYTTITPEASLTDALKQIGKSMSEVINWKNNTE